MMAVCVPELALTSHLKSCCHVKPGMHLHAAGPAICTAIVAAFCRAPTYEGQLLFHPMEPPPRGCLSPCPATSHELRSLTACGHLL